MYTFSWLFRNFGDGCAIYWRWVQWYVAAYVCCFHFLRPAVRCVTAVAPKGRTWAAASLGASMTIGVLMALLHYPNNVLESGTGLQWAPLEIGVDFLQPALFALGMTYVPLNMAWWGNTTLGCYTFHFYFKDRVSMIVLSLCDLVAWDQTGLLLFVLIIALCLSITSILGPLGHYFLLLPTVVWRRVRSMASRRQATCLASPATAPSSG